jgi:LDH2 family malate/lactate/ureidoglycolate dehydrogenase
MPTTETTYIVPVESHDRILEAAYRRRGYTADEAADATRLCRMASWHGIKTHNGIKALELDDHFGTGSDGWPCCVPGAKIEKLASPYPAVQKWNANRKIGQAVAFEAMETATQLAQRYGVGTVCVDNAFHYLWGGGYVMEAARAGFIGYTNCTSTLAEVVPFQGKAATLGTNPHSWGFPTMEALGFPLVIDWATSVIAFGKVQQLAREGKPIPPGAGVDEHGRPTTDAKAVRALLPFGGHKGYSLSVIDELMAALIGGSIPTLRGHPKEAGLPNGDEKVTCTFFFQVTCPDALSCGDFARERNQMDNLKAVIDDILGHGNEGCLMPGQVEADAALASERAGGLLFTRVEVEKFHQIAADVSISFDIASLKTLN